MRDIKFRAWAKDARVMHHVWNVVSDENGKYILLQYTGLRDKNGKDIYEGDIVRNEYDQKPNQQIIFAKGMFCLDDEDSPLWKYDSKNFWEIIGNIYENPELLTN